jgi:hypothetical protein
MTILHYDASQDFGDLAQKANAIPDAYVILTGKLSKQQFMEVAKLARHVKWIVTKGTYEETVNKIRG